MKNYRLNSTAADSITDEDVANTLAEMPDEVAEKVKSDLIVPLLTAEYAVGTGCMGRLCRRLRRSKR